MVYLVVRFFFETTQMLHIAKPLTLFSLGYLIQIFTHAIHNFKWVKITHMCLLWEQTIANHGV